MQFLLAILFIAVGGIFLGANGLALGGAAAGWMFASRQRGFLVGGTTAACFWLVVALLNIGIGASRQLLTLTASLVKLSGVSVWLLLVVSAVIAFLAGSLGGWLGGSLRQVISKLPSPQTA